MYRLSKLYILLIFYQVISHPIFQKTLLTLFSDLSVAFFKQSEAKLYLFNYTTNWNLFRNVNWEKKVKTILL